LSRTLKRRHSNLILQYRLP